VNNTPYTDPEANSHLQPPERQASAPIPPTIPAAHDPRAAAWNRREYYAEDSRRKSPVLAALMSIVPGLGQVYVGYYTQGFINILVVASLITILNREIHGLEPLAGVFLPFFWLYNIVDAARKATMYNQALLGIGPGELPDESRGSMGREALVGGSALILMGLILFLHTRFGWSLDWLERWWPIALVLVGGYLVLLTYLDSKKKAPSK
jgi:hypothetical protein